MNAAALVVSRYRLTITAALLFALVGAASWLTMPRQEDPTMPYRAASIIIPYPGADAETIERLVLRPVEERLAEVEQIKSITATARANVAVIVIELRDDVLEGVDRAWDDVERKLELAERSFPDAALPATFDRDVFDQESIVIAVHGNADLLALRDAALELERRLVNLQRVKRVILSADPGEQVSITLEPAASRLLAMDPRRLAGLLGSRNAAIPGGTVVVGGQTLSVRPNAEFHTIEEVAAAPIPTASGASVRLDAIARVERTVALPESERMRYQGDAAIAIGVVPTPQINVLQFGEDVASVVATLAAERPDVVFDFMTFQPNRVEARLEELGGSLLQGVAIVAAVVVLLMGIRLGLTVASVVPIVAMVAVALYAIGGGVLHQMSIAALVLALGLLVDNAIVVAEHVQASIDAGVERWAAAEAAVRELALPLGAATGTTLAAFVPMLLSEGATGDFTRALPIVIMVTLVVSYAVAILVTPSLGALVLRPRRAGSASSRGQRALNALSGVSLRWPVAVLVVVLLLVGASLSLVPMVGLQFFPASDRNQLVVDIELPEGTHVDATDAVARQVEAALFPRPEVRSVATFVGRGVPHFYYNIVRKPQRPHFAQMLVTTRDAADVGVVMQVLREVATTLPPGVEVIGQRIEQGPPVTAPIELRIYGDRLDALQQVADSFLAETRATAGAIDARHTLGLGAPSLEVVVDDASAMRFGVARNDVAVALLGATRGIDAGEYRAGDDPIPIVVRGPYGEQTSVERLTDVDVSVAGGPPVPVGQVAQFEPDWRPASIQRRNGQRTVSVLAQLDEGAAFSTVMGELGPRLDRVALPPGVRWEVGGEAEGSGDANAALLRTLPIGLLMLLLFLMGEFNSFRGVAIVMAAVPLAAVGVVPGLAFSGQPFGFMSMLGVFALIGIVVNNAIVLLDVMGRERASGALVADAITAALAQRTRPILLTTATTVLGLMPLAFSSSTFWPPLAFSMISGLTASTLLTLFAVPALYRLLHRDRPEAADLGTAKQWGRAVLVALLLVAGGTGLPAPAIAEEVLTLDEVRAIARGDALAVEIAEQRHVQVDSAAAQARALRMPSLVASGAYVFDSERQEVSPASLYEPLAPWLDATAALTPGLPDSGTLLASTAEPIELRPRHIVRGELMLTQPLYQPLVRPLLAQARAASEATRAAVDVTGREMERIAVDAYFEVLRLERLGEAATEAIALARVDLDRAEARIAAGSGTAFERTRAAYAVHAAERDRDAALAGRAIALDALTEILGTDRLVGVEPPPVQSLPASLDDAIAQAERAWPGAALASASATAAEASVREARAGALPTVQVTLSGRAQQRTDLSDDRLAWGVTVGARWSLWDGGLRRATAAARTVDVDVAALERELALRAAAGEVRRAWLALEQAERDRRLAEQQVELARTSQDLVERSLAAGVATALDADSARAQRVAAERALAEAEVREAAARATVALLCGL